jgi:putative endonuclease
MDFWHVYILLCDHNKLYTGIAKDPKQRFIAHQNNLGAKFTRQNKPIRIVYTEKCENRSTALKREIQIKKFTRLQKEELINGKYEKS